MCSTVETVGKVDLVPYFRIYPITGHGHPSVHKIPICPKKDLPNI